MLKKALMIGLIASLMLLSGCTTSVVVAQHTSVTELERRWDALEGQYGTPNTAFRHLFGESLKEIIYQQGEFSKKEVK